MISEKKKKKKEESVYLCEQTLKIVANDMTMFMLIPSQHVLPCFFFPRVMGQIFTQRKNIMKENGTQTNGAVGVACTMLMVASMKGSGIMTNEVAKECLD